MNKPPKQKPALAPWRKWLHEVIFEAETPLGKAFDVILLVIIVLSVIVVMLDSVESISKSKYGRTLLVVEWVITILFTIEFIARLMCVGQPWRYVFSFYGIVDLLSVIPTYLSVFIHGSQSLLVIRALRLLRIFRVFKLSRYLTEARAMMHALRETRARVTVFLVGVLTVIVIIGSLMYMIEGADSGFTSIPRSIYWAIVTMTTVGYGDIAPQTVIGQVLAAAVMILGYAIIIVPIGVFSAEILAAKQTEVSTQACPHCSAEGHDLDALHCKFCGTRL